MIDIINDAFTKLDEQIYYSLSGMRSLNRFFYIVCILWASMTALSILFSGLRFIPMFLIFSFATFTALINPDTTRRKQFLMAFPLILSMPVYMSSILSGILYMGTVTLFFIWTYSR